MPSFVRLVDYLVITTLHSCAVNAVDEILTLLQVQAGQTTSNAIIQSWTLDSDAATDCTEKEMDKKVGELFSTSNCKNIAFISVAMRNRDVLVYANICIFIRLLSQKLLNSILYSCLS